MSGRFYAAEQLSENLDRTPEGFLVCRDVPLARTGLQIYAPDEVPSDIPPGPDGSVKIERDPDEVFRPETIASVNGKPFANDHPLKDGQRLDVTPENYREFACGHFLNPHRGDGIADDLLFADLFVTDPQTIHDILENRRREISLGYDAEYEILGPGHAKQTNIVINHGALVDSGRCGPRCSIRDGICSLHGRPIADAAGSRDSDQKGKVTMAMKLGDYLRRAYRARDQGELEAIEKEAGEHPPVEGPPEKGNETAPEKSNGETEHHVHVHLPGPDEKQDDHGMGLDGARSRFSDDDIQQLVEALQALQDQVKQLFSMVGGGGGGGSPTVGDTEDKPRDEEPNASESGANAPTEALLGQLEFEAPKGTGDKAAKAHDSAMPVFHDLFQDTVAACEIIAPGMRLPTFDQAAKPARTMDCICQMRGQALELAYRDPEIREAIQTIVGHDEFQPRSIPVRDLAVLFKAVATHKRALNNSLQQRSSMNGSSSRGMMTADRRRLDSPGKINDANREFWASR